MLLCDYFFWRIIFTMRFIYLLEYVGLQSDAASGLLSNFIHWIKFVFAERNDRKSDCSWSRIDWFVRGWEENEGKRKFKGKVSWLLVLVGWNKADFRITLPRTWCLLRFWFLADLADFFVEQCDWFVLRPAPCFWRVWCFWLDEKTVPCLALSRRFLDLDWLTLCRDYMRAVSFSQSNEICTISFDAEGARAVCPWKLVARIVIFLVMQSYPVSFLLIHLIPSISLYSFSFSFAQSSETGTENPGEKTPLKHRANWGEKANKIM